MLASSRPDGRVAPRPCSEWYEQRVCTLLRSDGRVYGWGIADADATLLRGARRDRYPGPSPRDRVKTWQPRPTQYARAPESAQAARRGLKVRSHADVLK